MTDGFRQQLAELQQRYQLLLAQRREQIGSLWTQLRHVRWSKDQALLLRSWAHQMAGAAGSFGYSELGQCARYLEYSLDLYLIGEEGPGEPIAKLDPLVNQLLSLIDQIRASSTQRLPVARMPEPVEDRQPLVDVVDDDATVLEWVALHLGAYGYRIRVHASPDAMLAASVDEMPTAVVMDIGFPEGYWKGIEAIEAFHIAFGNSVPFVVVSARADFEARLRAMRAGAAAYLAKPLSAERLVEVLRTQRASLTADPVRVLVVDDDQLVAEHHACVLRVAGYQTAVLTDPLQILARIAEFAPDILLVDWHMPACTGDELAAVLSSDAELRSLPVVYLSADARVAEGGGSRSTVRRPFLLKPVAPQDLLATVSTCARSRSRTGAVSRVQSDSPLNPASERAALSAPLDRSDFLSQVEVAMGLPGDGDSLHSLVLIAVDQLVEICEQHGVRAALDIHCSLEKYFGQLVDHGSRWAALGSALVAVLLGPRLEAEREAFAAGVVEQISTMPFFYGSVRLNCTASVVLMPLSSDAGTLEDALARLDRVERSLRSGGGNSYRVIAAASNMPDSWRGVDGDPANEWQVCLQPVLDEAGEDQSIYEVYLAPISPTGEKSMVRDGSGHDAQVAQDAGLNAWLLKCAVERVLSATSLAQKGDFIVPLSAGLLDGRGVVELLPESLSITHDGLSRRLVFKIDEEWFSVHESEGVRLVLELRARGGGVMLGDFGGTCSSRSVAWSYWFDYAALSVHRLHGSDGRAEADAAVQSMVRQSVALGARLIARDIDHAKSIPAMCALGVRLFQGDFVDPGWRW